MDPITALCLLSAVALLTIWAVRVSDPKRKHIVRTLGNIPGPLSLPLLGTAYRLLLAGRKDFFKRVTTTVDEFGRIYKTWTGTYPEVHFHEAEHIEAILRSSTNISKGFIYDFVKPWLGTGLLTSTGRKWHSHRKLITPAFHFKILENFQSVFVEKSQILVQKLEKEIGNEKGFDVYPYITRCALDIICETAMGAAVNAQDDEDGRSPYVAAIYDISELVVSRLMRPWLHPEFIYLRTKDGKRFRECVDILHSFTQRVICERKEALKEKPSTFQEPDDLGRKRRVAFLDLLLEASEDGAVLSDEDIREEVDTFMFEGHDTTSASLCWTLFLLGNHPEIQERVFEEQEAIFQGSDRPPTMRDLAAMKYLERVLKEALRLYPSVPLIVRKVTEDLRAGEYTIPADCSVIVHIYSAHRNPKYFPDPEMFNPDNFLPERVQGRHPYAYVPFSAGSRNCIGQKFALLEEKTVLSALVRRFRVRALDRPEDVRLVGELVLRPQGGIRLALQRRRS